jgi:hypothetical protein
MEQQIQQMQPPKAEGKPDLKKVGWWLQTAVEWHSLRLTNQG